MIPLRPQPYRLKWPHTPHQQEAIDEMFGILFKAVRLEQDALNALTVIVNNLISGSSSSSSITRLPGTPGQDGDAGEMGWPGIPGVQGIPGLAGPPGTAGSDGDDTSWPSPGSNFQNVLGTGYVPYVGAIASVNLGAFALTGAQLLAGSAGGALLIMNNSTADAAVTGNVYITFQTAGSTRWYLGMSPSGATGNFELYDNIGALGLVTSIDKTTGVFSALKGLTVTTGLTTVGTVTAGAITTISPLIVHTDGAAQRVDIGTTGDTGSTSQLRFFQDSTHFNWQVGAGVQNNDTLTFTPSTAVNGTTFSLPLFLISAGGTTSMAPHTVSFAGGALLSLNNSGADAGVTNAAYATFQTASTVRYYVGISTSGGNGNFEIYDNVAGGLAFSVDKATANLFVGKLISKYNNILTTGWGVPAVYGYGRFTAQTAAKATVATYTVGAADGSFVIGANILVTTSTTHNFSATVAYTDEGNTARTATLNFTTVAGGVAIISDITDARGAVPYSGVTTLLRCKTATAITIATTGTFTTVTYNVEGFITQMA